MGPQASSEVSSWQLPPLLLCVLTLGLLFWFHRAVRARNNEGWGGFSPVSSTFIAGTAALPAPTNVAATLTATQASVAWEFSSPTPAAAFMVQAGDGTAWVTVHSVVDPNARSVVFPLQACPGVTFHVRVAGRSDDGAVGEFSQADTQVLATSSMASPTVSLARDEVPVRQ